MDILNEYIGEKNRFVQNDRTSSYMVAQKNNTGRARLGFSVPNISSK